MSIMTNHTGRLVISFWKAQCTVIRLGTRLREPSSHFVQISRQFHKRNGALRLDAQEEDSQTIGRNINDFAKLSSRLGLSVQSEDLGNIPGKLSSSKPSRGSRSRQRNRSGEGSESRDNQSVIQSSVESGNTLLDLYKEEIEGLFLNNSFPFTVKKRKSDPEYCFQQFIGHKVNISTAAQKLGNSKKAPMGYVTKLKVLLPKTFNLPTVEVIAEGKDRISSRRNAFIKALFALHRDIPNVTLVDFFPLNKYGDTEGLSKKFTDHDLRVHANAKLDILNICMRFENLPRFEIQKLKGKSFHVKITWDELGLVAHATRGRQKSAELAASIMLKKLYEKHLETSGSTKVILANDLSTLSAANAKMFIEYIAQIERTNWKIEVSKSTMDRAPFYTGEVYIGDQLVGQLMGMHDNRSAEIGAALVAAFTIKKQSPEMWNDFVQKLRQGHGTLLPDIRPIYKDYDRKLFNCLNAVSRDLRSLLTSFPQTNVKDQIDNENKKYAPMRSYLLPPDKESKKSEYLRKKLDSFLTDPKTESMRSIRSELPLLQYEQQVLELVKNNDVCVVVGATGSGKSTQVPQIVLDDMIRTGIGGKCNIICTQPRRIAASSVAERVASERFENIGESVGYQVRFDSRPPRPGGSINFVTTGVLLRQLQESSASVFEGISHVIIDEVHERSSLVDFLLVIIKRLIIAKQNGEIDAIPKFVLMSATVDTTLFTNYFKVLDKDCPLISIPGRTFPVTEHYLEDILDKVDLDLQSLKREDASKLSKYLTVEQSLVPIEQEKDQNTLIDWDAPARFSDSNESVVTIDNSYVPLPLIASLISHLYKTTDTGSILVFLPGLADIVNLRNLLEEQSHLLPGFDDPSRARVYMLHSSVLDAQKRVFEKVPSECRKIILATNIAETSITIPELRYVIDSGKEREKKYSQSQRMTSLLIDWTSQSNIKQRMGRAGRVSNGTYFAIFSKNRVGLMNRAPTPEILRSDLQNVCLEIKALGVQDSIANFLGDTIEPPSSLSVETAVSDLKHIGALTDNGELTLSGRLMALLPVDPTLARMILLGCIFKCLDPMLILASFSANKDPFVAPIDKKDESLAARLSFAPEDDSDAICKLNAFREWRVIFEKQGARSAESFARSKFLNPSTLRTIYNTAVQFEDILAERNIIPRVSKEDRYMGEFGPPELNAAALSNGLIKALLLSGSYPNYALVLSPRLLRTQYEGSVMIHPSSINFPKSINPKDRYGKVHPDSIQPFGTVYTFGEKVKADASKQLLLRDTTKMGMLGLFLFSKKLELKDGTVYVDGWIPVHVFPAVGTQIIVSWKELLQATLQKLFDDMGRRAIGIPGFEYGKEVTNTLDRVLRGIVYAFEIEKQNFKS
ncbi:P-loop containing nucleoside triphosphate hydrolase protein [Dipodascopsis uninucleata]